MTSRIAARVVSSIREGIGFLVSLVRREVHEAMIVPWWMGRSSWHPYRDAGVYWAIPLHWLARWGLMLWIALKFPTPSDWERELWQARRSGYSIGFENGKRVGRDEARSDVGRLVEQSLKDVFGAERYNRIVGQTLEQAEEALHGNAGGEALRPGLITPGIARPKDGTD